MINMEVPHRRFNPLIREWVLVSPHRAQRPWLGQVEKAPPENLPEYDPKCYLCPGNGRAGGKSNPKYTSTFVFDNDFPALFVPKTDISPQGALFGQLNGERLLVTEPVSGICRVVCFSPRHDLSLPELSQSDVETVVRTWSQQTRELGVVDYIQYVQVFENKGAMMAVQTLTPTARSGRRAISPTSRPKRSWRYLNTSRSIVGACYAIIWSWKGAW